MGLLLLLSLLVILAVAELGLAWFAPASTIEHELRSIVYLCDPEAPLSFLKRLRDTQGRLWFGGDADALCILASRLVGKAPRLSCPGRAV